jgi:hypothetical protein
LKIWPDFVSGWRDFLATPFHGAVGVTGFIPMAASN